LAIDRGITQSMVARASGAGGALVLVILGFWPQGHGQPTRSDVRNPQVREFTLVARRYSFTPSRIEVRRGDIVKISLSTDDIPHTFTIDTYRVSKKATRERGATIEFVADTPGTHVFYCSLTTEDGCRGMRGELVVR
jgi:plastocyanin